MSAAETEHMVIRYQTKTFQDSYSSICLQHYSTIVEKKIFEIMVLKLLLCSIDIRQNYSKALQLSGTYVAPEIFCRLLWLWLLRVCSNRAYTALTESILASQRVSQECLKLSGYGHELVVAVSWARALLPLKTRHVDEAIPPADVVVRKEGFRLRCHSRHSTKAQNYKNLCDARNDTPLGTQVVMKLTENFVNPSSYTLYFDNFFTSTDLLKSLGEQDFRATGTRREN
ncbi:hypothetical protein TNCV_2589221 [Trichonephila clavipes]|nr:hypothetical protein TNCV_2589221 [Trichonephila clavipes]